MGIKDSGHVPQAVSREGGNLCLTASCQGQPGDRGASKVVEGQSGDLRFCQHLAPGRAETVAGPRSSSGGGQDGTPEVRDLFGRFHMDEVALTYTVSRSSAKQVKELIVSNREVRAGLF